MNDHYVQEDEVDATTQPVKYQYVQEDEVDATVTIALQVKDELEVANDVSKNEVRHQTESPLQMMLYDFSTMNWQVAKVFMTMHVRSRVYFQHLYIHLCTPF